MAGIFGEFFLVSVSHETKHENSSKNSGKFGAKFGANSGEKFEKFGELSDCSFSDLIKRIRRPSEERKGTRLRFWEETLHGRPRTTKKKRKKDTRTKGKSRRPPRPWPPPPQGPYHTKNTTVIVIHYVRSKTLRR